MASFTRAAAAELVGRDLPIPENNIGTLHSFCYRAMGSPKIAELNLAGWNQKFPGWAMEKKNLNLDEPYDTSGKSEGEILLQAVNRCRGLMLPKKAWIIPIRKFYDAWQDWKKIYSFTDFTGMIEYGLENIGIAPGFPRLGFFDEVQDFTRLELKVIHQWIDHMDMAILAGDDDQAIYGFKGADPEAFIELDDSKSNTIVLSKSWRIPRAIHKFVEKWIKKVKKRLSKEYKPRDYDGEVQYIAADFRTVPALVDDVRLRIKNGKRIMILATCGYMLQDVIRELRDLGIPYYNPYKRNRGDWNPLSTSGTSKSDRILAMLRPVQAAWGTESALWTAKDLKSWTSMIRSKGVMKHGAKKKLDSWSEDLEVPISRLLMLFEEESLRELMFEEKEAVYMDWLEKNALESSLNALKFPIAIVRNSGSCALREAPKVIVGTIHSVKGGETDCVYIFPDLSYAAHEEWIGSPFGVDQIIRQFYVGFTRARESLILCTANSPQAVNYPSI